MSVTLRKRKNQDGTVSLVLDIYVNGKRSYEFLKELKLKKPVTPQDRQDNKYNLDVAKTYAAKRSQQIAQGVYEVSPQKIVTIFAWMEEYLASYKKKDKRNISGAISRFKSFRKNKDINLHDLSELMVTNFRDFLIKTSVGEGAASYFARFKKIIKWAYKEGLIKKNPCEDVKPPKGKALEKEILTVAEIQTLSKVQTKATQVRDAFVFCCLTGLRWIDVIAIKWSNINGDILKFRQEKTGEDLSITLNSSAVSIINNTAKTSEHIFSLPTADGANRTIGRLVKRAGIEKAITWHCARHSFGTNVVFYTGDIFTVSKLLGHKSTKHTERYLRAAEEMKRKAVENINI